MAETAQTGTINVTLPDGKRLEVPAGSTIRDVAFRIGAGLGRACLGGKINDDPEVDDLRYVLDRDCRIQIVTDKTPDGLSVIRHSASHIMADAICRVWPDAKLTIGPATADGFYYDIDLDTKITPEVPAAHRSRDGEDRRGRHPVRAVRDSARRGAQDLRRGRREVQGRTDRGLRPEGRDQRLPPRRRQLRGSLPRPARPDDRTPEGVQAALARRRVLARRREQPDAPARLRHRVRRRRRSSTSTWRSSRRRRPAITASSARSSTCFHVPPIAPAMPFFLPKGAGRLQRPHRVHARAST